MADFPEFIELDSLNGTNGFRLDGIDPEDFSGGSVASAGDVNGDGIDDIIIGAAASELNNTAATGESYVVFGRSTGFSASLDLSSLDGTNGFLLTGIDPFDNSGRSVSSAGDINGDGIDDIIVGAPASLIAGNTGESYVVFGRNTGFAASIALSGLTGSNGFRIDGISNGDATGGSVSSAGDFNGDGFDDVIVGASSAGVGAAGESYVLFGTNTGFGSSVDLSTLNGTNGFQINGASAGDFSGASVSSAGDVNGDGFDDIIIGARSAAPNGNNFAGASYVVFGRNTGIGASFDLASLNGANGFRLEGIDPNDISGNSVSSAGDVNGDGFDDIIIGASSADPSGDSAAGESYVVFGRAGGFALTINLSTGDQTILGGVFDDTLSGMGGDDELIGGGGADRLMGDFDIPTQLLNAGTNFEDFAQTANYAMPTGALTIEMLYRLDGPIDLAVIDHILFLPNQRGSRVPASCGCWCYGSRRQWNVH